VRFAADHYFQIGHAHYRSGKPCQDYAASMARDGFACAIVSDGCSTAGQNRDGSQALRDDCSDAGETDNGSRIVVAATRAALASQSPAPISTLHERIRGEQRRLIRSARVLLGFSPRDMLATCAYVAVAGTDLTFCVHGDGVIALKYVGGRMKMCRYEWIGNIPFYPAYEDDDLAAFVRAHGEDLAAPRLLASYYSFDETTSEHRDEKTFSLAEGIAGVQNFFDMSKGGAAEIEYAAVFTDGVTQIKDVAWEQAVIDLLSFKTASGEFAKRRMARHLERLLKEGHETLDDISYAVVHIEREASDAAE